MKSIRLLKYFLIVFILLSAPFYSCEDYLTVNPVSQYGPDYVFGSVENATRMVLGAYSSLGGDAAYGIRVSMYYPYDNDEMMGQGGTPYPDNERRDIAHYNVQPSNTQLQNPFNQLYSGIEKANICIHYIPKSDLYTGGQSEEQAALKRLHGEALTLRAQYYYELIRNWGDVPTQFMPSAFSEDLFLEKSNREETYDQILSDLEVAETLVPWRSEVAANERITQGAVRALRARIALAAGGYYLRVNEMTRRSDYLDLYQIALNETKAIIDQGEHHLNPSFEAIWKDAICKRVIDPTGEVIWEVGMSGGNSAQGDSKLGYYNGPRVNSKGNSALTVLPTTFYAYDQEDKRRDVTCAIYDLDANKNVTARPAASIVDGKYRRDWIVPSAFESDAQYFGLNWVMIRYSDVLLMFAEAENEINGPSAAAYDAINQVRRRAFGKPINTPDATVDLPAGLSKSEFFDAIVQERMLELCGEGIRKYDLIRWNMLGQKISETKAKLAAMAAREAPYNNLPATMYYQPNSPSLTWLNSFYSPEPSQPPGSASITWIGNTISTVILTYYAASFEANKSELLPFHTNTIEANTKLVQNYGY